MERSRKEDRIGDNRVHVFIVGSKGIPAQYGGFETFVENLTAGKEATNIQYHVSCMNNDEKQFIYNGADCFNVKLPTKGAPGRIFHVARVLGKVEKWKAENINERVIVYILGCRIGPLLLPHARKMQKQGIILCVNPDGLEWKRDKWNIVEKKILKYCESCLVCYSDLVICDSRRIQEYIAKTYDGKIKGTRYIAYGAIIKPKESKKEEIEIWCWQNKIKYKNYYLAVGRFVPENNLETIISEFMKSNTDKSLVVVSNIEHNKFYKKLKQSTQFHSDARIKMVGSVYNQSLLQMIREGAYGYIHGHEVGGTNPSLLEALANTDLNLLLDVAFNREVAENSALYWEKSENSLKGLIEQADKMDKAEKDAMGSYAKKRITDEFNWEKIVRQYESVWLRSWENK